MEQISRIWDSMTPAQQRRLVILLGVIAVTTAALVSWSLRPSYALLYSDLSSQDAAAVTEYLREQRVPYRLTQQGTAIEVPEDRVYELRLKTASKGLLGSSTVGLELFDRSTLPGTDFANRVNLQRALQGELSRTISAMKEVAVARVHLVLPEKNLFGEQTPARASVLVSLRGARGTLSHEQVVGIQTLVAQAVEGLSPEKVTVVDEHGRVLGGESGDSALTAAQYESKVRYETLLRERLQSMMDALVGPYKSVVQVEAEVNSTSEQVSQEQVQPAGGSQGALRRESVVKEDYSGGSRQTGGPAGAASNLFGAAANTRPGTGGTYSHSEQTREYEFSRTTTKTIKPPGSLRKVSVAVLVDDSVKVDEQTLVPVLQAAMGYERQRGDTVEVKKVPLEAAKLADKEAKEAEKLAAAQGRSRLLSQVLRYVGGLALAVVLGVFLLSASKQVRAAVEKITVEADETSGVSEGRPALAGEAEGQLPPADEATGREEGAVTADAPEASGEVVQGSLLLGSTVGGPSGLAAAEDGEDLHEKLRQLAQESTSVFASQRRTLITGEGEAGGSQ